MNIKKWISAVLAAIAFCAGGSAQAALVQTYDGNDCAGVFGQGFENCKVNGSPVIAKYDTPDLEKGTLGGWTINPLFPTITGAEWDLGGLVPGAIGSWTYTPGPGDPLITFYVAKGGSAFNLYSNDGDPNSGDWSTPINPNNGKPYGLSHLTFYDTGTPVPEPVSLALLGIGLLGVGAARRFKRA